MNDTRKIVTWMLLVVAAFMLLLAAGLIAIYFQENRAGLLASVEMDNIRKDLSASPQDEALKQRGRQIDARIRHEYLRNRLRFEVAGYMLLCATLGWLGLARWRRALAPQKPLDVLAPHPAPPRLASFWAVGAMAGIVLGAVGFYAALGRVSLPPPQLTSDPGAEFPEPSPGGGAPTTSTVAVWPNFRGPDDLGVAAAGDYPTTWSAAQNRNILWKTPLPFVGKSSCIIWGNNIFVSGGEEKQHGVACLDRATGAIRWQKPIPAPPRDKDFKVPKDTGFAAPTPATDGKRVAAVFASGALVALDFKGNILWSRDLGQIDSTYGFATSLLIVDGIVIVQLDQSPDEEEKKSRLLGIDAGTGKDRWVTPRPVANSWSSPALIRTPARVELVTCSRPFAIAYNPATGAELWRAKVLSGDVCPSPAFGGGLIFVTQDGAELTAIRPGGSGDVTKTHVAWKFEEGMPDCSSPVADGKYVMQAAAGGHITVNDTLTGAKKWDEYLPSGQSASPILVGNLVYIACEDGMTRILEWTDKYKPRDSGDISEPLYSTPAFLENKIYIRGQKHLFCVGK
ncbi:MAG: PQQ-binding-like beta-propeller repeat protein [Candidatus Sumerlaeota bacterium]|nr:PQQ-binding-like beta-propeller repeat protein [Candidatus Sumerlaeota bacterium]